MRSTNIWQLISVFILNFFLNVKFFLQQLNIIHAIHSGFLHTVWCTISTKTVCSVLIIPSNTLFFLSKVHNCLIIQRRLKWLWNRAESQYIFPTIRRNGFRVLHKKYRSKPSKEEIADKQMDMRSRYWRPPPQCVPHVPL